MSGNLFYLLTLLPLLPELGETLTAPEDAIAKIREESDAGLLLLADLLDFENEIETCARSFYIDKVQEYQPALPERLPESLCQVFASFTQLDEADWLNAVYAVWFETMLELGDATGSGLLKDWAFWEYSLRTLLRLARTSGTSEDPLPAALHDCLYLSELQALVDAALAAKTPMQSEKLLDQARIDFLRQAAIQFDFSRDELIAYMLELRIHRRYARLSPEKGRKLLEEVTRL